MQDLKLPTLNETIAIIVSVLLGTLSYIGYTVVYKRQKVNWSTVLWILSMNTFLTFVASEVMKLKKWGEWRTAVLPLIAYAGQYAMNWFDRRHDRVFDSLSANAGVNVRDEPKESSFEQESNYDEESQQENDNGSQ